VIRSSDEMHTAGRCRQGEGAMDAANLIKPCAGRLRRIALYRCHPRIEYHANMWKKDRSPRRRFQPGLLVLEPPVSQYPARYKEKYELHQVGADHRLSPRGSLPLDALSHRYITGPGFLPTSAIA